MSRTIRWIIIVSVGAAAVGIYFYCRAHNTLLPETEVTPLFVEQQWLLGLLALYPVNFVLAAHFKHSFSASAARMLFFGAAAFIVLSHAVDILGEHRDMLGPIFGAVGGENDPMVETLRARLAAAAAMLTLCLVCIAVGFESESD